MVITPSSSDGPAAEDVSTFCSPDGACSTISGPGQLTDFVEWLGVPRSEGAASRLADVEQSAVSMISLMFTDEEELWVQLKFVSEVVNCSVRIWHLYLHHTSFQFFFNRPPRDLTSISCHWNVVFHFIPAAET